jgi:Mce-associated membrane protein
MTTTDPIASTDGTAPAGRSGVPLAAVSAVVVAIVVAVLLAVVAQRVSAQTASNHGQGVDISGPAAQAIEATASSEVRATLTYSYQTLQANFATAEKGLTPAFRTSYEHTTATSVTPLATKYHAISSATVIAGGVSAATSDTATVLLFVDQTVRNTQLKTPRLDQSRLVVSMQKIDGRWLVSQLSPI